MGFTGSNVAVEYEVLYFLDEGSLFQVLRCDPRREFHLVETEVRKGFETVKAGSLYESVLPCFLPVADLQSQ